MHILELKHPDFRLIIELPDTGRYDAFKRTFRDTRAQYSKGYFITAYTLSEDYESFHIWNYRTGILEQADMSSVKHPVLFDNTSYKFTLYFYKDVIHPVVYSKIRSIEEKLAPKISFGGGHASSATIDFSNEPGYFDLILDYSYKTIPKRIVFTFEVFSAKLNFRVHFPQLLVSVEQLFPKLVIDYLKKTYHHFETNEDEGDTAILWWTIFSNLMRSILRHAKVIMDNPYKTSDPFMDKKRVAGFWNARSAMQEKRDRFIGEPARYIDVKGVRELEDNQENRYVKYILKDIVAHYDRISAVIAEDDNSNKMTAAYRAQLEYAGEALRSMLTHPLMTGVGEYDGRPPRSQVVQYQPGYAGLIREWQSLKKGYHLLDGLYDIELRDINYLYKLWCFWGMSAILQKITNVQPEVIGLPEIKPATFRLTPKKHARLGLKFHLPDGQIVEIYQEMRYREDTEVWIENVPVRNVRPDIFLLIGKEGQTRDQYEIYVFDVEYGVQSSIAYKGIEVPRDNDMTRVFSYKNVSLGRRGKNGHVVSKKDIAGKYILIPGKGNAATYERYYREVTLGKGTGGFPFSPVSLDEESLLEKHLRLLLSKNASAAIKEIVNFGKTDIKDADAYVFIVPVAKQRFELLDDLVEGTTGVYPCGAFEEAVGAGRARIFAPYIEGEGIASYYRIAGISMKALRDVYPPDHPCFRDDGRKQMVLLLQDKEKLPAYVQIKGMANNKRYTQLKLLMQPDVHGFIKTVSKQEVYPAGRKR